MPSKALIQFKKNMIDVYRLNQAHDELSPNHRGRRGLGHITRSSVLMLCASWELYAESILIESTRYLANKCNTPNDLPLPVRKHLSKTVKEASHDLKPLELAGEGWRNVLDAYCCQETRALNTPKHGKLKPLYFNYLGLEDIQTLWTADKTTIDEFVGLRGDIAHNGRSSEYVTISIQMLNTQMIYEHCLEMDNNLCDYLYSITDGTIQPWRKTRR